MATPIPYNEAPFALDDVARLTGGRLLAAAPEPLVGVAIDSRAVRPGNLFVALRGATHDGERFLPDAVRAGASAVLVHEGAAIPEGVGAVQVRDTERALGDLAAEHRRRWNGPVVAITGSAGKTSTKELAAAALAGTGARVLRTAGNLNNLVGLPMMTLSLGPEADVAVLELGTNRPGEIARLAEIARPDVGVITLVAAAHTEGLGSVEKVAEEKASLLMALHPSATAVVNGEDGTLRAWAERSPAESVILFGRDEGLDVRLRSWAIEGDLRTRCTVELPAREQPLELRLHLLGEAAALNVAAALAVVVARGGDPELAARALESLRATPGRMMPVRGPRGALLIDDSYNANPRSVALALDTAVEVARARGGRAIAVLGDMLELGARSDDEHDAVGRHAAARGVELLVACGERMARAARTAASAGLRSITAESADEGLLALRPELEAGDVVLVKGSRSMGMERVVEGLGQQEGSP